MIQCRIEPCKAASSEAAGLIPEQRSDWEKFTETLTTLFPVWVMTHNQMLIRPQMHVSPFCLYQLSTDV